MRTYQPRVRYFQTWEQAIKYANTLFELTGRRPWVRKSTSRQQWYVRFGCGRYPG